MKHKYTIRLLDSNGVYLEYDKGLDINVVGLSVANHTDKLLIKLKSVIDHNLINIESGTIKSIELYQDGKSVDLIGSNIVIIKDRKELESVVFVRDIEYKNNYEYS